MSENETHDVTSDNGQESAVPTQADLYDDLRRIGELEDQKREIQTEIDHRMDKLKAAIPHLDSKSLLGQMLTNALAPKRPAATRSSGPKKKATAKKRVK